MTVIKKKRGKGKKKKSPSKKKQRTFQVNFYNYYSGCDTNSINVQLHKMCNYIRQIISPTGSNAFITVSLFLEDLLVMLAFEIDKQYWASHLFPMLWFLSAQVIRFLLSVQLKLVVVYSCHITDFNDSYFKMQR